jgi:probable F420-dependent oxidoreductase
LAEISEETTRPAAAPSRRPVFSVGLRTDPARFAEFVRHADALGFAGLWVQDTLNAKNVSLDPLHQLSFAAAVTGRMRLGVSVLFSGYRNPAVLARDLATIDQLSQGRLTVGLGVGNAYHRPRLAALGIDTDRPALRLVEGIGVMRALWSQEQAEFHGEIYDFSGIASQPKPVQRPGPPIIIGARSEPALRRAVRIADGWTGAAMIPHAQRAEELAILRDELSVSGRDPASFALSVNVYAAVEPDAGEARRRVQDVLSGTFRDNPVYDADGMAERVAICGSIEDCAGRFRQLADEEGIGEFVLHPLYDHARQLERLAEVASRVAAG